MNPTLIIIAAILGPLLGFLGLAWKLSGRIATTEASKLWEEADLMRREYREEISRLQDVIDRYTKRVEEVERRNEKLVKENEALTTLVGNHEETIASLRKQVNELSLENQRERRDKDKLRARVMELELNNGKT